MAENVKNPVHEPETDKKSAFGDMLARIATETKVVQPVVNPKAVEFATSSAAA